MQHLGEIIALVVAPPIAAILPVDAPSHLPVLLSFASTLMALTPVFILIPYAFIYHQRIRARELLGVVVSMTGVALFFLL